MDKQAMVVHKLLGNIVWESNIQYKGHIVNHSTKCLDLSV